MNRDLQSVCLPTFSPSPSLPRHTDGVFVGAVQSKRVFSFHGA